MKIATVENMRKIDSYCINQLKIPGIVLMENAALKVVKNIDLNRFDNFCIICAKGNNGGDGFAVARHLYTLNKKIQVFLIGNSERMSADCKINYDILKNMKVDITQINSPADIEILKDSIQKSDLVIDAIFGTGLSRKLNGIFDLTVSTINENSKYIISIDAPSGLDSDTGEILGNCVKANKTVTFQLYKRGFLSYGTDELTGNIIVEDIGIPQSVVSKFENNEFVISGEMIKDTLKVRDKYSHKGDYGRVVIFAGSCGFTGAAYICTQGAVRSGAGLVTLCCKKDIQEILSSKLVEAMTISLDEEKKVLELLSKSDAVAIGPGLGNNEDTLNLLKKILNNYKKTVVVDADAINVLGTEKDILKNKQCKIIITPHVGEMSRITGFSIDYINKNRIEVSKKFARDNDIVVLLKGYNTIITDGSILAVNPTGNSSMASGGMGDCLTGIITSFAAQGYKPMEAASMAAFVHGYCGEKLSKNMFCVNASHVLENIPFIIKELQG